MKTAAIVMEMWKLDIFKKHLDNAKFVYSEHPGIISGTLTLRVSYQYEADLQPIVEDAQSECDGITLH